MKLQWRPDPATVCVHCHHGGQGTSAESHAKTCPQVTRVYPVTPIDVEMLMGCRRCDHVFSLGDAYFTPLAEPSEGDRETPVEVVLCGSCAGVAT